MTPRSIQVLDIRAQRLLKKFGVHGVRAVGPKRLLACNVGGKTVAFVGALIGGWGDPQPGWFLTKEELIDQRQQRKEMKIEEEADYKRRCALVCVTQDVDGNVSIGYKRNGQF